MEITVIGGQAPSGRWVFFKPDADFSKIDEAKLQRFTFEADPLTTRHTVEASGIVYDILERIGVVSPISGDLKPGAYNSGLRLAVAILRCQKLTTPESTCEPPTLTDMMNLPPEVLGQYQFDLRQADELTKDDLAFFHLADKDEEAKSTDKEA